jgi:hypothetical protein
MGKLVAWARADEEQGRKTLHSHWQLWVESFNKCRDSIFSDDNDTRNDARYQLLDYVDKVISSSYGNEFVTCHTCTPTFTPGQLQLEGNKVQSPVVTLVPKLVKDVFQERDDKYLRHARHKDHCFDIEGKVMKCKTCAQEISTTEMINEALGHWINMSSNSTHSSNAPLDLKKSGWTWQRTDSHMTLPIWMLILHHGTIIA